MACRGTSYPLIGNSMTPERTAR